MASLRRSPVDGKFRRWETRRASQLGMLDITDPKAVDYPVQVVTGVFKNRREAFAGRGKGGKR